MEYRFANNKKPAIAMFGGSLFLFPHPIKELAKFYA
jgi:glycine/serine hydroxymethyltransferase